MYLLPFYILAIWFGCWLENRENERKRNLNEIEHWWKTLRNNKTESKPKYRMKEVRPEDDELFLTDAGDFDEAFRL